MELVFSNTFKLMGLDKKDRILFEMVFPGASLEVPNRIPVRRSGYYKRLVVEQNGFYFEMPTSTFKLDADCLFKGDTITCWCFDFSAHFPPAVRPPAPEHDCSPRIIQKLKKQVAKIQETLDNL